MSCCTERNPKKNKSLPSEKIKKNHKCPKNGHFGGKFAFLKDFSQYLVQIQLFFFSGTNKGAGTDICAGIGYVQLTI